jgi:lipopolysaccharide/colanic/teichoic acid biosynthesis glycosyltransferase
MRARISGARSHMSKTTPALLASVACCANSRWTSYPNLWSVVVGDMRIVGPRPEALEVLKYHTPEELIRFTCKPGITGLAQISGRKLLTWGETLALDMEYDRT